MQSKGAERDKRNLTKEVILEQSPNEASHASIWWKSVQAEGASGTKALRQGHACVFED